MKRLVICVLVVAAALTLSYSPALAQEECSELEQAFSIPESFPLDGEDWVIVAEDPATASEIEPDGYTVTRGGTNPLSKGVWFYLLLPATATITHIEYDLVSVGPSSSVSFKACTPAEIPGANECDSDPGIDEQTGLSSGHIEVDLEPPYDNVEVLGILIQVGGGGAGSVKIENLIVEGVLGACLYRPVHDDDIVSELANDDQYELVTDARSRVYAVSDAVVNSVGRFPTGYDVGLTINGVDTVYYVGLSTVFASVGDHIIGGCVLGYVGDQRPGELDTRGSITYEHDPALGDWHDYEDSLSATPCNQQESNCINPNPNMDYGGAGWLSRNVPSFFIFDPTGDSVMILNRNSQLYESGFQAAVEDTWYVTVIAAPEAPGTNGQLTVTFGGVTSVHPINTFSGEFVTITTPAISPAETGETELQLTNSYSGTTKLKITFACLHEGDVQTPPGTCFFDDPQLNTDSFTTEGGAAYESSILGLGRYSVPPDGVLRGPVDILAYTDSDKDFRLHIQAATPDGETTLAASIVDSGTEALIQEIPDFNFPASLFWVDLTNEFTVTEATSVDGDLYLENTGDNDILVSVICLSAVDGIWSGYANPDYANYEPFAENCTACEFPESFTDVVAWLSWLGCVLRYLIACLLYGLINDIFATALATVAGLGLLGRWLGRAITIVATWLLAVGGRFLGSIISSLIPLLNAVLAWLYSLPFFRSLLDAISIAGMWLDAIFSVLVTLFTFFGAVLSLLGSVAILINGMWGTFFTAVNTASASYTAIINCANPEDPFYLVCLGMETVNYFVAQIFMISVLGTVIAIKIGYQQIQASFEEFEEAGAMLG